MGLDASAFFVRKGDVIDDFSFVDMGKPFGDFGLDGHWDLCDWMEKVYTDRGGDLGSLTEKGQFAIRLYPKDIDALERKINEYVLEENPVFETDEIAIFRKKPTHSLYKRFLDGNSSGEGDEKIRRLKERDLRFVGEARYAIADGRAVYYCADW